MAQQSSRLQRLLTLLDTGSTQATRLTAARQIGDIAKSHPQDLTSLLKKVSQYLRSKNWDTRVAAAHAIGSIAENVKHISLTELFASVISQMSENGISCSIEDLCAWPYLQSKLTGSAFRSFDMSKVLEFGALLASGGQEYDIGNDNIKNPKERLVRQKQSLRRRLGLDVCEQFMDISDVISMFISYKHAFRGFAAKLSEEQASQISKMPGVVSVFPNSKRKLHTTHSWDFMGLLDDQTMETLGYSIRNQENIIIGFIDTGIWPESPSFSDTDMPAVPPGWKGQCQSGESFNASSCNRKVIGARYYRSGYEAEEDSDAKISFRSARDSTGHGSHTASIAAGRYVANMNYKGLAAGGARGGAPMARIAVYKTCWDSGCYDVDLLAAFDDAIRDGVHILSLSLGAESPQGDYFSDAISVGSFHAANRGVLVVASAGNEGTAASATNLAPWILTVAASSTDRDFTSEITLGNGAKIMGESLSPFEMNASKRIISASAANGGYFTSYQSSYCLESSLNKTKSKGKVLVCRHAESSTESKVQKSKIVKDAGGVGMILIDERDQDVAIPFVIPSAIVGKKTGARILSYLKTTRNPVSRIFGAKTVLGAYPAPRVAAFSSKGPNALNPEILKPDVTAPGLNILAAWSPAAGNMFNILSGTSMACPHVTGIATLVKAVHPSWSPSAIKSAIMTTATILDKHHRPIIADPEQRRANAFDYGSGFVNPARVLDPGLIYDSEPADYVAFLCSLGYDQRSLHQVTRDNSTCDRAFNTASDLNYPSISVPNLKDNFFVTRIVTNVGKARSVYKAVVSSPPGVRVSVIPNRLIFTRIGQKMNFTVKFKITAPSKGYAFGFLSWRNGRSQVTSPLVVQLAPGIK